MALNKSTFVIGVVALGLILSSCWTKYLFINSAFNSYFVLLFVAILLYTCTFIIQFSRSDSESSASIVIVLHLMLVIYSSIHGFIIGREYYYWLGFMASSLFLYSIAFFLNGGAVRKHLLNILLVYAAVQSTMVVLQYAGIIRSLSSYFQTTGLFENPNYTAVLLAYTFPIVIDRIKKSWNSVAYFLFAGLICICILMLLCRTAVVIVILTSLLKFLLYYKCRLTHKRLCVLVAFGVLLLVSLSVGLYGFKQKSANGRLFILKQTCCMIAENPVQGVGYGLFEKEYNLWQSQYLISDSCTETESENARWVYTAYNEFLEQWVQGGIVGFLLFLSFVVSFCSAAWRCGSYCSMSIALSVTTYMLFNGWQQSYPILFVSLILIGFVVQKEKITLPASRWMHCLTVPLFLVVAFYTWNYSCSQYKYASIATSTKEDSIDYIKEMESLKSQIGTSSNYYCSLGFCYLRQKNFRKAQTVFLESAKFTSSPGIYSGLLYCYKLNKNEEKTNECEKYLKSIHYY